PKVCKLVQNRALAHLIASKLCLDWSPEQIAGWLKRTYPDDETYQVSHETIYRSLFIQARGALKKELMAHLRRTRGMRRSRHHKQKTSIHSRITDAVSISERPAAAEDRAVPGVTGKGTFCSAARIPRLQRSSSVNHATSCSRRSPAKIRRRSLTRLSSTRK